MTLAVKGKFILSLLLYNVTFIILYVTVITVIQESFSLDPIYITVYKEGIMHSIVVNSLFYAVFFIQLLILNTVYIYCRKITRLRYIGVLYYPVLYSIYFYFFGKKHWGEYTLILIVMIILGVFLSVISN